MTLAVVESLPALTPCPACTATLPSPVPASQRSGAPRRAPYGNAIYCNILEINGHMENIMVNIFYRSVVYYCILMQKYSVYFLILCGVVIGHYW